MKTHLYLCAAATLLAVGLLSGCGKGNEAAATAPATQRAVRKVPVTVEPAKVMDLQRSVNIVGTLMPLEKVNISNRVVGNAEKVHVDLSDRIKPGQKLLEIDARRFELAVQQAENQLAEALARLGFAELPDESTTKLDDTAPVRKARSEHDLAVSKLERSRPLYEQRVMKEFEYFDVQSAEKVAAAGVQAARDEARALVAQVRQYKTLIELRKKDLKDAIITAPDGATPDGTPIKSYVVTKRHVSVGEFLREGTALFELMADETLKLQARVPERFLSQVSLNKPVTFRVESFPGKTFEGVVKQIDPSVDIQSRTFLLEAYVNNEQYAGALRPGSFVQGQVQTIVEKDRVMVPVDAVTSFVGVTKVYVVGEKNGEPAAKAIDVETGVQQGKWVELTRGTVKAGDRVIVTGVYKLVDGTPIEIK